MCWIEPLSAIGPRTMARENAKLKKLLAEQMLDMAAMKDLPSKKWRRPL
jgi:hypothetical protein